MPKKREFRQYICINEDKLIEEIEKRPMLYVKAMKGYRKPNLRENAWNQVATALNSPIDECKKRWRSLRDSFMKQYRLVGNVDYNVNDNMPMNNTNKKKWLFYDRMNFLLPHIDIKIDPDNLDNELIDNAHHTSEISIKIDKFNNDDMIDENNSLINTNNDNNNIILLTTTTAATAGGCTLTTTSTSNSCYNNQMSVNQLEEAATKAACSNASEGNMMDGCMVESTLAAAVAAAGITPTIPHNITIQHQSSHQQLSQNQQQQTQIIPVTPIQQIASNGMSSITSGNVTPGTITSISGSPPTLDCDEQFLMSCAPAFKRLSVQKNALARLKIQTILYEIEFDNDIDNNKKKRYS